MTDQTDEHGLPLWPAAERNKGPILKELERLLAGREGLFLEVASGTGQHAAHFQKALPSFRYQPTERDPAHLDTLRKRAELEPSGRLLPPLALDVSTLPWPVPAADVLYCANMIHIAPLAATRDLFLGAAQCLVPGGLLLTYGPYMRDGQHTAPSNETFDQSLRQRNPEWGVRDLVEVRSLARAASFQLREEVSMPANNLLLVWSH